MSVDYLQLPTYQQFKGQDKVIFEKKQEKVVKLNKKTETAIRLVPPLRKAWSSVDELQNGCYLYAAGMAIRFINEGLPDWKEVIETLRPGSHHRWDAQEPFRMIYGTLIHKTKVGEWLTDYDKTLFETKAMQFVLKKIGLKKVEFVEDKYFKIYGNPLVKIIAESSLRVPLQGAALFGIMELDGVIKAKNNKNRLKELVKGAITVVCTMGMAALIGCIGRHYGKLTDLLGLGAGVILGGKLANMINAKLFSKQL